MIAVDRKFRLPRIWSNRELKKFAHLFSGDVANVSGWQDQDKEGKSYKEYFSNAQSYTITNYKTEARGFQGSEGEIFLDLEKDLPQELVGKFDVVFNHTVLEHIFEVEQAFKNLCLMSKDAVILVVPFMQQMHTDYGDYWRFTPLAIEKLFQKNGFHLHYSSFNGQPKTSVYLFALGVKDKTKWLSKIPSQNGYSDPVDPLDGFEPFVGCHANEGLFRYYFRKMISALGLAKTKKYLSKDTKNSV